jgi:uncharacterized damage-inducible protein DinB
MGISRVLFDKATDGLDEKALRAQVGEKNNSIHWLAGHLANIRCGVGAVTGLAWRSEWDRFFARGTDGQIPNDAPGLVEIRERFARVSDDLALRFESLTDVELAAPFPRKLPIPDRSIRGAIAFLAYHESYHIGQMAYIRKWLGFPGLVDG